MATSKTARSSEVKNAPKEKVKLTPEKAIQEIRNLRAGKLAVLNAEYIDLLLADYDAALATVQTLAGMRKVLTAFAYARQVEEAEQQLANEIANHKDTQAELSALLDKQPAPDPNLEPLTKLVAKLTPLEIIEGEPITAAAIRALGILKDKYDSDAVTIHDLMETTKRQEKELLKLGVIINPNPGVDVNDFIDFSKR